MSPADLALRIAQVAATSTLAKDVLDLMQIKIGLQAETIRTLEAARDALRTDLANLEAKHNQLHTQLQRLKAQQQNENDLSEDGLRLLTSMFDLGETSETALLRGGNWSPGDLTYWIGELIRLGFAQQSRMGFGGHSGSFELTHAGRARVMAMRK